MTEHQKNCNAPICVDCKDTTTVWYAGEKVCNKLPLNKIQKKQININNLLKIGKYKYLEKVETPKSLSK